MLAIIVCNNKKSVVRDIYLKLNLSSQWLFKNPSVLLMDNSVYLKALSVAMTI